MPSIKFCNRGSVLLLATLLAACGNSGPSFPPQTWEDVQIELETRPPRLEEGMNEFLVIATRGHARPAHDIVVSLANNNTDDWQKAIQDGHVGAYRRAMRVPTPDTDVLFVHIEHDNSEVIYRFSVGEQQAAKCNTRPKTSGRKKQKNTQGGD